MNKNTNCRGSTPWTVLPITFLLVLLLLLAPSSRAAPASGRPKTVETRSPGKTTGRDPGRTNPVPAQAPEKPRTRVQTTPCASTDVVCAKADLSGLRDKFDANEAAMHRDKDIWGKQVEADSKAYTESKARQPAEYGDRAVTHADNVMKWDIRQANHVSLAHMNTAEKLTLEQHADEWIIKHGGRPKKHP